MESLIKQRRVRFTGLEQDNKEDPNSIRERSTPPQRIESFEGEKKTQNWFQRQFSGQMNRDYDSSDGEFATAVAAAAFAIHSFEESEYQKTSRDGLKTPITKVKTRKEDSSRLPETGRVSRRFSGKEEKEAGKPMGQDSKSSYPSYVSPAPSSAGNQMQKVNSTRLGSPETKADAWEKAAMGKIERRYEKMSSDILAWENEKKVKAKLQMERKQSEIEERRARNLQHYQKKLTGIDHIAAGARAQAEEKRKNEESVVKGRAKKIRSTGKVPVSCFCC
ncbi:uncharacterized protein LOC132285761 isoform X2 [Cornus florida]|uniref:uncharacterized protein LOC132285761 isoform X2 n=1 Tax=Cornus florida TaxID=4283 RepID=UPI00289AF0AF|nr:uncharacterized protein LOC132285761 isoform X2 [Cornus florida]